jgi:hypothetical protein
MGVSCRFSCRFFGAMVRTGERPSLLLLLRLSRRVHAGRDLAGLLVHWRRRLFFNGRPGLFAVAIFQPVGFGG